MKNKFKLGLDIHGVIDLEPEIFSKISSLISESGHEVHILTGSHITDKLIEELKGYNMVWDNLFSISDHHKEARTEMWYDKNGNPWIDDLTWNKTKGIYCKENEITFHMDDTRKYGQHFETEFMHLDLRNADQIIIPSFEKIETEGQFSKWFRDIFNKFEEFHS